MDDGRRDGPGTALRRRAARLAAPIGLGALVGLGFLAALLATTLVGFLPRPIQARLVGLSALGAFGASCALRAWSGRPGLVRDAVRRALGGLDVLAGPLLRGGLGAAAAAMALGMLATWLPHYLTWPLWRDPDNYATMAQAWDRGVRPYRDFLTYNFPGHIYLWWALGRVVGWGRPVAFYALDAGLLLGLGAALVAWSRRRLGATLPGLIAGVAYLFFYTSQGWQNVAQRDWHAALGIALALMALEAAPPRAGRVASALAFALALTIRPHVVLFLPALASAVDETARRAGEAPSRTGRALVAWGGMALGFAVLGFAPLILQGLADDLVRHLRLAAYGGPYATATPARSLAILGQQLADWKVLLPLAAAALMVARPATPADGRLARTWGLALLGALLYKPLHPTRLEYLDHPLALMSAVALAPPAARLAAGPWPAPADRALLLALLLYELVPVAPQYCRARASLAALGALARGGAMTEEIPPGCERDFPVALPPTRWDHYRALLDHLRRTTDPETSVADAIARPPFEAVNGPLGRPSPFLADSGVCLMMALPIDLDTPFAAALERTPGAVVVWSPEAREPDPRIKLGRIAEVIRRRFRFEARFGDIEVWRRPGPSAPP